MWASRRAATLRWVGWEGAPGLCVHRHEGCNGACELDHNTQRKYMERTRASLMRLRWPAPARHMCAACDTHTSAVCVHAACTCTAPNTHLRLSAPTPPVHCLRPSHPTPHVHAHPRPHIHTLPEPPVSPLPASLYLRRTSAATLACPPPTATARPCASCATQTSLGCPSSPSWTPPARMRARRPRSWGRWVGGCGCMRVWVQWVSWVGEYR